MVEQKLPCISVIITAYNRKEYLLDAIKSVINQTLDKKYYEIIVIKNYNDSKIDEFISDNNIKNIFSYDNSLSGKIYEALKIASGNIISFLEDDDLFLPFKLKEVYNVFQQNDKMIFYKHEVIKTRNVENVKSHLVDIELGKLETKSFFVSDLNLRRLFLIERKFNLANVSSISIRKVLYLPFLQALRTNAMVDIFLFYLAVLVNNQAVLSFEKKPLSIWRIHNSASQFGIDTSKSEFLSRQKKYSKEIVVAYKEFIDIITVRHADIRNVQLLLDNMNIKLGGWYVEISLLEGKKCNLKNTLSFVKTGIYLRNLNILLAASLGLFSLFVPNFAGQIFNLGLWKRQFIDQIS